MTREEKANYDRDYRERKREEIRLKKKLYCESENGRAMQKRQREKRKQYHNEYTRLPEQRKKERQRRHKRDRKVGNKFCIVCEKVKHIMEFEFWDICPDKRSYICKECEKEHQNILGCKTRNVVTAIITRPYTNLTRYDIAKHPYLIEANKYLILLKQLIK